MLAVPRANKNCDKNLLLKRKKFNQISTKHYKKTSPKISKSTQSKDILVVDFVPLCNKFNSSGKAHTQQS
jgi:hypothetical protein